MAKPVKQFVPDIYDGEPYEDDDLIVDVVSDETADVENSEWDDEGWDDEYWAEPVVWDEEDVQNIFCPTGKGGGIDPTCKPGGIGGGGRIKGAGLIRHERDTPPPPGNAYKPDVESDINGDGITDFARVGVGAHDVPPPPGIGRLPNLTPHERRVETAFIKAYEANPDGMADNFRRLVTDEAGGGPKVFGTDDAKALTSAWGNDAPPGTRSVNRATLNAPLHQTANALAKRAFSRELDTLSPGDEIMVTVGGCGAGKGYALKNVPQALGVKNRSKVIWDSAGDQNATENAWVQGEAQRRGLKVNYVYVHADPRNSWAHPQFGVVKRAADPKDGRMVDAKVFADSYAIGARNHNAFHQANRNNPNANFIFLENKGTPRQLNGIPKEALSLDRRELARFAIDTVEKTPGIPSHVRRGATIGTRIWEDD